MEFRCIDGNLTKRHVELVNLTQRERERTDPNLQVGTVHLLCSAMKHSSFTNDKSEPVTFVCPNVKSDDDLNSRSMVLRPVGITNSSVPS